MKNYLRPQLLLLLLWVISLKGQESSHTLSGIVIDAETQEPLPGVNIIVQNKSQGTITDFDGNYDFVVDPNDTIEFSYIGYQQLSILAKDVPSKIFLSPEVEQLNELVLVGYGVQRKTDVTGASGGVKGVALQKTSINRVEQALQGQVSGVQVQNLDASPNAKVSILIRGANSIAGGSDPLVIVDGFQGADLRLINPNDIESIEILKDASATAIYGSRGSNGVVLVKTKSGTDGKPKISLNIQTGIDQIRKKINYLGAHDYALTLNARRAEVGGLIPFSIEDIERFKAQGGTNWENEIFRLGSSQNVQAAISGAKESVQYYLSGTFNKKEGIVLNSDYQNMILLSKLKLDLSPKISLENQIQYNKEIDHPTLTNDRNSPIFAASAFPSVKPIYDEAGNYTLPGGGYGPNDIYNPYALAIEPIRDHFSQTISTISKVIYTLNDAITFESMVAYKSITTNNNAFDNGLASDNNNFASIYNGSYTLLQNTNILRFNKQFNDKHNLSATLVAEQQRENFQDNYSSAGNFSSLSTTYHSLGLARDAYIPHSSEYSRSLISFLGRLQYDYDKKYYITLTGREDGSSVFGKNNKYAFFPSVALSWNIGNEDFMQESNLLSDLKLRASYGKVGSQTIEPYTTLAQLQTSGLNYTIDGVTLYTGVGKSNQIANPDLKWESTVQADLGLDLSFLQNKIEVVLDVYKKNTHDLLLKVPLPQISGSERVLRNVGEVQNVGFEFYLKTQLALNKVDWKSTFNYSINRNKVVELDGTQKSITLKNDFFSGFTNLLQLEIGEPLGIFKGLQQQGIWSSSEADEAAVYGAIPGSPRFLDVNNDKKIDDQDIITIGHSQPKFTAGWQNYFSYGDFDFNIFIQGVFGNDIYNLSRVRPELEYYTGPQLGNRWAEGSNESTDIPSFRGQAKVGNPMMTSRWLENGSYVRLKSVSLGYTLPLKNEAQSVRVFLTGLNLLTLTNYSGYDPESATGSNQYGGVDLAAYPAQKTLILGGQFKF